MRIEHTDEDSLIAQYCCQAEAEALRYMERSAESLIEEFGEIPVEIIGACLNRVASAYKYREDITDQTVHRMPQSWEDILISYIPADRV